MIRTATITDLNNILKVYKTAREYMRKNGNETQWGSNYPPKEMLETNIKNQELYVFTKDNTIHGVFAFIFGDDPSYEHIEGSWKNKAPYSTIHHIASDGKIKGVFKQCLNFCKEKSDNIRIDTHENNKVMKYLLKKNNFKECGIIYAADKTPRVAYQFVK